MSVIQQLVNFEVYNEGTRLLGIADITLPEVSYITTEISGSGIAGKIDVPTQTHIENMELTIKFRSLFATPVEFMEQASHLLCIRGAVQDYDPSNGTNKFIAVKIDCRVLPTSLNINSFTPASLTESENKFNLAYIRITVDDVELWEHDIFNFINKQNGVDAMAPIRTALGLEAIGE